MEYMILHCTAPLVTRDWLLSRYMYKINNERCCHGVRSLIYLIRLQLLGAYALAAAVSFTSRSSETCQYVQQMGLTVWIRGLAVWNTEEMIYLSPVMYGGTSTVEARI
jgi:hypothetical protein